MDASRSIKFRGGTEFAQAMTVLFGQVDSIGEWLVPAEHRVHPDDADMVRSLLDGDGIPYSIEPDYLRGALHRLDGTLA